MRQCRQEAALAACNMNWVTACARATLATGCRKWPGGRLVLCHSLAGSAVSFPGSLLHQLLDLLFHGGDLDVAADDFAVGTDQEHGGQDDDAILVGQGA